jgi:hypothetical protein
LLPVLSHLLRTLCLQVSDLYDPRTQWASYIINAIKAKELFVKDVNYIVKKDEVRAGLAGLHQLQLRLTCFGGLKRSECWRHRPTYSSMSTLKRGEAAGLAAHPMRVPAAASRRVLRR